ncbi:DMT family transporter [Mannheimia sp. AT1]|uniref:DMT family transporter n=1 Tax=Mannheimia cairinae TaxID=3025936 RepID=A0ABT5MLV0_9PAST|nr:DMT family transporter [Mannheimia cairinae]MDD0823170.1 DMT family transporter [Mannheimia cairinae]MDD0825805.1 DMT family transporter [Mannheimia cairinae]
MSRASVKLGYLSLIIATLFWGGNFVLGKVLSTTVPPITLTYLRWLPAFLILAILFYRPTLRAINQLKPALGIMWVLGLLGVILFPATLYQGLKTTTALNASLYLAVVPVLVLFLNRLAFKEKIRPIILTGAIISLVGVFWLLTQGDMFRLAHISVNQGDLWAIASTVSWAVYCCVIRLRPIGISNTVFLTTLVGLAVITLTPFFIYELFTESANILANLTALQWSGVGYLVIGPSILSYAFWNFGIAIVGSAKGSVMTNFTPLFAALFSILLLNEPVQSFHIISAILITVGVLICSYKK